MLAHLGFSRGKERTGLHALGNLVPLVRGLDVDGLDPEAPFARLRGEVAADEATSVLDERRLPSRHDPSPRPFSSVHSVRQKRTRTDQ